MEGSLWILMVAVLQAAVRSGTPILFVCIGEIYAERSGILNVGLEGLMLVGAYLFGGADALQLRIQAVGIEIPTYFLMMLPYVLTIGILVLASRASLRRRIGAPAALALPYAREER